jgi:hypothetical protein
MMSIRDVMEPESAEKDYEKQKREDEQFHTDLLCCCIPDVLAERAQTPEGEHNVVLLGRGSKRLSLRGIWLKG